MLISYGWRKHPWVNIMVRGSTKGFSNESIAAYVGAPGNVYDTRWLAAINTKYENNQSIMKSNAIYQISIM